MNNILNLISLNLLNQNYSNRISFNNNENYLINFCSFYNIIHSGSNGGALFISSTLFINLLNSFFYNIILSSTTFGGASCLIGSQVNVSFNCFILCSCGYAGFGIYQESTISNMLNHSIFLNCFLQSNNPGNTWCLRGGFSVSVSLNCSECINKYREACGHFGWNPLCYTCFLNNINNNGIYIYFPYSKSPEGIHEFTNYINNTASTSIILFSPFDKLKNNIFLKNNGVISSGSLDGLFQNCIFDSIFSGVVTNTINCLFLQNEINSIKIIVSNSLCLNNNNYFFTLNKFIFFKFKKLLYYLLIF